jgi:hypothetical protein
MTVEFSPTPPTQGRRTAAILEALQFPALGRAVVAANGADITGHTVVTHNYTSVHSLDEKGLPVRAPHISPTPELDFPVSGLTALAVQAQERALTLTLTPGLKQYLLDRGLILSAEQIIDVDPNPSAGPGKLGMGYTDPVEQAAKAGINLSGHSFVASFPTPAVRGLAQSLGATPVQRFDPEQANNKVRLHLDREIHGLNIAESEIVTTELDAILASERLAGSHKVWLKAPRGVGGDLVEPLIVLGKHPSEIAARIYDFRTKLFAQWESAANNTSLSAAARKAFWNPNDFMPAHMPLLIETDARASKSNRAVLGELEMIGSNIMLVRRDGSFSMHGDFVQCTDAQGAFHGSESCKLPPDAARLLEIEMAKGARYCAHHLQLNGFVGWDYMVVRHADGSKEVKIIELNARPSASLFGALISEKVRFAVHEQMTLAAKVPLNSFDDLLRLVPAELMNTDGSGVLPLQFYGLHHSEKGVLFPSPKVKVLIGGPDKAAIQTNKFRLFESGLTPA